MRRIRPSLSTFSKGGVIIGASAISGAQSGGAIGMDVTCLNPAGTWNRSAVAPPCLRFFNSKRRSSCLFSNLTGKSYSVATQTVIISFP